MAAAPSTKPKGPVTIKAESRIDSVTVYESSAQIHRVAKIVPEDCGDTIVQFRDLPSDLNRDSLQVALNCEENAVVRLSGITFDTVREPRAEASVDATKRQESREKVRELDIQRQTLQDEIAAVESQLDFRGKLFNRAMNPYEEDTPQALSDIDTWKRLMSSTLDNKQAMTTKLRELQDRLEKLDEERASLDRFSNSNYETSISYSVVRVHLLIEGKAPPAQILLQLSYVVNGSAKWEAAYDLRVDSATNTVSLSYNAVVQQSTSQHWNNVRLQLSTARSAVQGNPPELSPWRATLVTIPESQTRARSSTMSTRALADDEDGEGAGGGSATRPGAVEMDPAVHASSTIEEGATSVSFNVPGEHVVSADNEALRVTLATVPLKVEFSYLTRPRLLDAAFAQIKATNLSSFTLVDGSVTVFVDHQYISKSRLSRIAPRGTFKLSLGVDSGLSVKYKQISSLKSEEGGVFSATRTKTVYKESATVKNLKPTPVTLAVERALPVSNDSSIVVELTEPRYEKDTNAIKKTDESVMVQTIVLASMEEVVLPFTYSVVHPINETIVGI